MTSASKPWWQQATAVVSLGASGTITGFSVTPHHPAKLGTASPAHIRLLALRQMATQPASSAEVTFRTAIVNAAEYYLRLAQHKTPAEMQQLIWDQDSIGGADHGESCAAFASLTLEKASQVVGRDSWVTGGTSYPWPLHQWADVRVDPNPASPGIVSVLTDAQTHHRWHQLGDGYTPQPGDWVLFNEHVEVVTRYAGGVLSTIGGDSLPNFSVNAHTYRGSLADDGVVGFVDNGDEPAAASPAPGSGPAAADVAQGATGTASTGGSSTGTASAGAAAIPGLAPAQGRGHRHGSGTAASRSRTAKRHPHRSGHSQGFAQANPDVRTEAAVPGAVRLGPAAEFQKAKTGAASIPGAASSAGSSPHSGSTPAKPAPSHHRSQAPATTSPVQLSSAQRAFIAQVAPGAVAAQRQYGVPASVTIAQAIDESGWGQSKLASQAHNLFGMKGAGPAGSDTQLTEEYEDGHWQVTIASFRAYHSTAQSIEDHGKLLATSGDYSAAMNERNDPDAFASALTGVYATDPQYGQTLINLMQQYNLYQYDHHAPATTTTPAKSPAKPRTLSPAKRAAASIPGAAQPTGTSSPQPGGPSVDAGGPSTGTGTSIAPSGTSPQAGGTSTAPGGTSTGGHGTGGRGATHHGSRPRRVSATTRPGSTTPSARTTPSPARTPSAVPPIAPPSVPAPTPASPRSSAPAPPASRPAAPRAAAPRASAPRASAPKSTAPQTTAPRAAAPRTSAPSPAPSRTAAPAMAGSGGASRAGRSGSQDQTLTATLLASRTPPSPRATAPAPATQPARYDVPLPKPVRNSFVALARTPLLRSESIYQDVASDFGLSWELLAACDWMQCESRPRHSPVHGERLGTVNPDGTVYHTRSQALAQCAEDLMALAGSVYGIDLTSPDPLSVRDLANVYAAFRWGALLKTHRTSAMEFPYSVAGLTVYKINMRWPSINEPHAPDKPGTRFRRPFGAVPVVLALDYPATVPPIQA